MTIRRMVRPSAAAVALTLIGSIGLQLFSASSSSAATPPNLNGAHAAVVVKSDGTENAFWRGAGGQLYNDYFRPGMSEWAGPTQIGSGLTSDPAALALPNGGLDVFYSTGTNSIQHSYFESGVGWKANSALPGASIVGDPAAALKSDGTENFFFRGSGGQLYNEYFRSGVGWTSAAQIGSGLTSDPAALALEAGGLDVFYSRGPSAPAHSYLNSAGWHANVALPSASIVGTPSVALKSDGTENVFFRGSVGQLYNEYFRPGLPAWTTAAQVGSGLTTDPGAVALSDGGMDVFYGTGPAAVAHSYFEVGNGWHADSALPGLTISGAPAALETSKSGEDVFWLNGTSPIHDYFTTQWFGIYKLPAPAPSTPPALVTLADLQAMYGSLGSASNQALISQGLPSLNQEMATGGITTPARKAAFLATLLHESGFRYNAVESVSYGTGYNGHGFIQLTGQGNFAAAGSYLGVDLVGQPDLAASLAWSAKIARWYWTVSHNLNSAADQLNMGAVDRGIGYGNVPSEDLARCNDFKTALQYYDGGVLPSGITCYQ